MLKYSTNHLYSSIIYAAAKAPIHSNQSDEAVSTNAPFQILWIYDSWHLDTIFPWKCAKIKPRASIAAICYKPMRCFIGNRLWGIFMYAVGCSASQALYPAYHTCFYFDSVCTTVAAGNRNVWHAK